ncbi:hypothetical protein DFJ43DRAFT_1192619 [Lentinula guzmanii]|uniref:Uncharacterized protein n=1 Tax=Lentinula guzmanii TaxID=2804957 RepID=A0AA38JUV8_9AGAR|nr:hypothetical protein DFJ43DRAFT_1192619 [Lentinula guzmanii]
MFGQLTYSVVTELPAVYLLYDSPFWSGAFLIFENRLASISYFDRFERELEALRKEFAESAQTRSGRSSPTNSDSTSTLSALPTSEDNLPSFSPNFSDSSHSPPTLDSHPLPNIESGSEPNFDGLQMKPKKDQCPFCTT